jgi:GT2 family glycosyltransferase
VVKAKVTIGILTFNRAKDLKLAIESALEQVFDSGCIEVDILIVDNGSTDNTQDILLEFASRVSTIRLDENIGCPAGRNLLYSKARGEYIINLDDDGQLTFDVVQRVTDIFSTNLDVAIVAFRQSEFDSKSIRSDSRLVDTGSFSGGLSAFRRSAIVGVGGYPGNYFLLGEEEHLSLRILHRGWRIVYASDIVMLHKFEADSQGKNWDHLRYRNLLNNSLELFPMAISLPAVFLKIMRYFLKSAARGTLRQYFSAVVSLVPFYLSRRSDSSRFRVSIRTIFVYFYKKGNERR